MKIKQFYDKNLAHASYAILSENEIALIDPSRNPEQYFEFAKSSDAKITAIIETHPHADFVSSHLEVSNKTGAGIYVSRLLNPLYKFIPFDEGDELKLGKIFLIPMNTPGHSPDSISILIRDENGKDHALATGDTLFVGDVGRPDLRESAGAINNSRDELARMMYNTINEKLLKLSDDILVYPAHGAGSLCGKATSTDTYTTIGREKKENYALQPMSEDAFIDELLKDQPFIPAYFGYDVELNRIGAPDFAESVNNVKRLKSYDEFEDGVIIIDTRKKEDFIKGHFSGAVNIKDNTKFETWLGTIVPPEEKFYLVADSSESMERLIGRAANIGYELICKGILIHHNFDKLKKAESTDTDHFLNNPSDYTIVDVRNWPEIKNGKIFKDSVSMPLNEIRKRFKEIPVDKPIAVHCAGGSRSAVGSSLLESLLNIEALDVGVEIKKFEDN